MIRGELTGGRSFCQLFCCQGEPDYRCRILHFKCVYICDR